MRYLLELKDYLFDYFRYHKYIKDLFWFKKNKGLNWLNGQNFGDYLSMVIVGEISRKEKTLRVVKNGQKLLALGSILHFAKNNDIIWGSGVNGKMKEERHRFNNLDVRMVRGPLTEEFLKKKGINVPHVFGDPALLLPHLFPKFKAKPIKNKIIIIPNYNELGLLTDKIPDGIKLVSPLGYWKRILNEILSSELVLSSSLHGIILAEAFDVPVRFVMPIGGETIFKYRDYYEGTGRALKNEPSSFLDGISKESGLSMTKMVIDIDKMLLSFPRCNVDTR